MSKKKDSIFSKIFKPKKSSCCCNIAIVEEPDEPKDEKLKEKKPRQRIN